MITIKSKSEDIVLAEGETVEECVNNYSENMEYSGLAPLSAEDKNAMIENPWYGDFENVYFDEE